MGNLLSIHSPARIIIFSFFITILLGTLALSLPIARHVDVSWLDLFFTATSSTCVAGLFSVSLLETYTFFGKCIILLLIQIGGLGLITMTLFFVSLFVDFGFKTQLMAGKLMDIESWKTVKQTLLFIVLITLYCELIGAFIIYTQIQHTMPQNEAWLISLFQAVSSFCNAGISLFSDRPEMVPNNNVIMCVSGLLMYIGGIGFITWHECSRYFKSLISKEKRYKFSLYSKIILTASSSLLIATAVIFWLLERERTLAHLSPFNTLITTMFHAISFKSAGFLSVPITELHLATLFLIILVSFIGSSPASTGSGIKISTLVVLLGTVRAAIRDRSAVEIRGRRIPNDQVYRSAAIMAISLGCILLVTFCLIITETQWDFFVLFFETVTAFTSAGLTLNATTTLSIAGKLLIMATLLIGRVGSFTLVLALKMRTKTENSEFTYPEERIMIG